MYTSTRKITHLVVHCSATKASADIDASDIHRWHREKGYRKIGYHFVIKRDGTLQETIRKLDEVGAHVSGHNSNSIGICMAGGLDDKMQPECNYTAEQFKTLRELLNKLHVSFPNAEICGHRDFPGVAKACPCFNVKEWYSKNQ